VGGGLPSVCGCCSWGTGDGELGGGLSEGELSLAGEGERANVAGRRTKFDEGGVLGESTGSSDAADEGVDGRGKEGRTTAQRVGQETKE